MAQFKNELVEIGRSDNDGFVLYLDNSDGRYWVFIYANSYGQEGEAPHLESCSLDEATEKYKIIVSKNALQHP